jgi:hypothetical protein
MTWPGFLMKQLVTAAIPEDLLCQKLVRVRSAYLYILIYYI